MHDDLLPSVSGPRQPTPPRPEHRPGLRPTRRGRRLAGSPGRDAVHLPAGALRPVGDVLIRPDLPHPQAFHRPREVGLFHQPNHPRLTDTQHVDQLGHGHELRLTLTHATHRTQPVYYTNDVVHRKCSARSVYPGGLRLRVRGWPA